ncbi:hydroxymethylglutaryl-CoA reductase, degradative [archaeon]|nr:hydroxymethylglutaryl-CoA reductase, degradative [archaeon]
MDSRMSGFHKFPLKKRRKMLRVFAGLTKNEMKVLSHNSALEEKTADIMIENVVGTTQLPLGIATNFRINDKDYLIPMAIEETSVVAAASHAAKLARELGGFMATSDEPIMIGQIQLMDVKNIAKAKKDITAKFGEIKKLVNNNDSILEKLGGGLKGIEVKSIESSRGIMFVVHILVDVRDAMGANAVNTYCEIIAPYLEKITGGRSVLKIISNLAVKRMVRVKAVWKKETLGDDVVDGILDAYELARVDPYRATTHNKGIMNGIDSVIMATCNDWRAVEAGAHSYAAISGAYKSLTKYKKNKNGDLVGTIELPLAVGLVGGATRIHPIAKISLKILNAKSSKELAEVAAAVGLANNFAALRAMVKEGIRRGHMKLHATNIAANAGAHGEEIDIVAKYLIKEDMITVSRAHEILKIIRSKARRKAFKHLISAVEKKVTHEKKKKK